MKDIDAFEISFSKIIDEPSLIKELSKVFKIKEDTIWNWDWNDDPKNDIVVNISYIVSSSTNYYPLLITILFNETFNVADSFEIETGILLSKRFECSVIIDDTNADEVFLEIFPNGKINKCIESQDQEGATIYVPTKPNLSITDIIE